MRNRTNGRCCRNKRVAGWLMLLWACLFVLGCDAAESGFRISLTEDEWSWIPGEVATFTGSVAGDAVALDGMTIRLTITPEPRGEENGDIVFTSINEKKIKIRKQSSAYTLTAEEAESGEIRFTGSWFIPENSAFFKAGLRAELLNTEGNPVLDYSLSLGANDAESGSTLKRIPVDIGRMNMVLGIIAGILWVCAMLRIALIHKRKAE